MIGQVMYNEYGHIYFYMGLRAFIQLDLEPMSRTRFGADYPVLRISVCGLSGLGTPKPT